MASDKWMHTFLDERFIGMVMALSSSGGNFLLTSKIDIDKWNAD